MAVIVFRDHFSVFFFYCQRSVRNPLALSAIAGVCRPACRARTD